MSEKNFLNKVLSETALSRRSFIKWSAALGGTAALAGGLNFGLKTVEAAAQAAPEGKWVSAACWHNCGGRCVNKAYVVDGVVIRQKTDDSHPDSPNYPQARGCVRGRNQRRQVYGPDRLKYPMKRLNWSPGGGKKELRGRDEWVRISWEEALDSVATEVKRIIDTYGNKAILGSSPIINALGGGVGTWGQSSYGAWPETLKNMTSSGGGSDLLGSNDRMDYRNTKLIVIFGGNPAWSSQGNPTFNYLNAKRNGTKFIIVTPMYNESIQVLADQWIPCRPSTDAALLIGMAHYMITNNLQDQEFLDKYTVGFDSTHMPEGTYYKDNFRDYVLGTFDGIPKTPEWASEICGTHPDVIRRFAQEVATTKPMVWSSTSGPARSYMGEQYCQAFLTVGWMTGNVGKPGSRVETVRHQRVTYGGPALVTPGGTGSKTPPNPIPGFTYGVNDPFRTDAYSINMTEQWDAVLNGKFTNTVQGKMDCDIRMVWSIAGDSGGNDLNQVENTVSGIRAYREKLEFVVSTDIVLSTKSKFADIVLPVATPWEKDLGGVIQIARGEGAIFYQQVTPPVFEARDDMWVEQELAKRLGVDPAVVAPLTRKQMAFNQYIGSKVRTADNTGYEPLITITAEDIAALGVEGEPQTGRIALKEVMENGVYQVPRSPGDAYTYIDFKPFIDDPVANPISTPSGKFEIYCQVLSDKIKAYGYTETPPIAQYRPPRDGYEATFSDWANKVKGPFPLQLLTTHYMRRSHSVFNNIPQLRRAWPQEMWMNTIDAEERGIKNGDTVLISSEWGKVLRPAYVTERIMPGVIDLGEGAWVELDEETGIDKAGCTNMLSGTTPSGQGVQTWNTNIAEVKKWDGAQLSPDYTWPQRVVFPEGGNNG
jgi:anaerobic dimethyl sulfoxide reductase subunit A